MDIKKIKKEIPEEIYSKISKYKKLREPQELAIKKGILKRRNIVIASPTASGKTLPAFLACVKGIYSNFGKAIYIVPLKALASEKYEEFSKLCEGTKIKVAISVGDLDSSDNWLEGYDIIVTTSEKADSLLRHGAKWIPEIGTIVVDEVHLLTEEYRGPTLEVLITRLKQILPHAQIIALSATIKNAKEIAEWLNAEIVESNYRPVKLYEGIYFDGKIIFKEGEEEVKGSGTPEKRLILDTLKKKKQILFFLSSRRIAESLAKRSAKVVEKVLNNEERKELEKIAKEILNALERPTKQCKELAECVKKGVAFHHAGLVAKQRNLIEKNFRKGIIKVVCATTTLSLGINMPSYRVVVRDLKRFSGFGAEWIPVLEWKQMVGRAGRPEFDNEGQGIAIAKSEGEVKEIFERYVEGIPEQITSKLGVEPILRMHVLALISDRVIRDMKTAEKFFERTFYGFQYKNLEKLNEKIKRTISLLKEWEFVNEKNGKVYPTFLGKRVSELYIDPLSGHILIEAIRNSEKKRIKEISFLHVICLCLEMHPLLKVKPREFNEIYSSISKYSQFLLVKEPSPWDYEYEEYMNAFKTALPLLDWINEKGEDEILEKYKIPPGELYARIRNGEWLLYSACELAKILKSGVLKELKKLHLRIKNGVKEELLPLVSFKGIGRMRARKLFSHGIRSAEDIRKVKYEVLAGIVGKKIAERLKEEVRE